MGAVAGRPGIGKNRRKKIIEELAQDLDPASRDAVMQIYEEWKGEESEQELNRVLGTRRAKKFLRAAASET